MYGFGVAFTAKYSRNPGFQENASLTAFAFSRIPFHRRDETVSDIFYDLFELFFGYKRFLLHNIPPFY